MYRLVMGVIMSVKSRLLVAVQETSFNDCAVEGEIKGKANRNAHKHQNMVFQKASENIKVFSNLLS